MRIEASVEIAAQIENPLDTDVAFASLGGGRRDAEIWRWFVLQLGRAAMAVIFVALWAFIVHQWPDLKTYISEPRAVGESLWELLHQPSTWRNLGDTLLAMAWGFGIGALAGTVAGLVMASSRLLDGLLDPWVAILNSLPRIALAPLFILWFGISMSAKVALTVSIVFFVQLVATRSGIKSIDPDLLKMCRVAGVSKFRVLTRVILPWSLPAIFAGLRLSLVYSLLGTITSEMIAAQSGIGQLLVTQSNLFQIQNVFALLALLAMVAAVLNAVFALIENRLLRWQR